MNSKDNATDKFSGTVSRSHHIIFHCEYYGFHVPQSIHDIALTAHEIEHQSQYQNGDKKEVFETLVGEALDKASGKSDPYKDNKTLEYKAQQVQDRARILQESRSL